MPASLDPRPWSVVLLACLPACGPGLLGFDADETSSTSVAVSTDEDEGEGETGNGFETDGESESEGESDTEPEPEPDPEPETTESETGDDEPASMCGCVDLEPICTPDAVLAMPECAALPAPCGIVNGNAEAAECVLQLLIAGEPARFAYDLTSSQGCPTGFNNWEGWFYILAPGQGIENECFIDECGNGFGDPPSATPSASHVEIEPPSFFAACLGESAKVMTDCIFDGLSSAAPVAECR
jgi:hypothetical protein